MDIHKVYEAHMFSEFCAARDISFCSYLRPAVLIKRHVSSDNYSLFTFCEVTDEMFSGTTFQTSLLNPCEENVFFS